MQVMESSPEIRELANRLMQSKQRPPSIKRAQKKAWGHVKKARTQFLRASARFDKTMKTAAEFMRLTADWERSHRELTETIVGTAIRLRDRASVKEMESIKRIRRQLTGQFQEKVQRVPVLRRVLSRSRSRPPTPLGNSGSASAS